MLNVIDHADVDCADDFSQPSRYVIQHYGKKLDEAIRSDSALDGVGSHQGLHLALQAVSDQQVPDFWKPVEEWELD